MIPDRLRALSRFGLHAGVGVFVFAVAFTFSFPYGRIKDLAIALASQQNLDLEIASAGPALGVAVAFKDISLQARPIDGRKSTRYRIDSARVGLSPLAAAAGEAAYNVSADLLGGELEVNWRLAKSEDKLQLRSKRLALAELTGVKQAINLPLAGTLDLALDLVRPDRRTSGASGTVTWKCGQCALGDGKAKLKVAGNPFLSDGMSVPRIRFGNFQGEVDIEKGLGRLRAVQAKSPDGELFIEGEIRLADPLPLSYVDLYLRFKLSDTLLKNADKLAVLLEIAESMGKRPDGFYGFRLMGTLNNLSGPQWQKTSPFAGRAPSPALRSAVVTRRAASPQPRLPVGTDPLPAQNEVVAPVNNPAPNLPRYPTEAPISEPDPNVAAQVAVPQPEGLTPPPPGVDSGPAAPLEPE